MYNATSYHHAYSDAGVFCIHASSDPSQVSPTSLLSSHLQIGDVVNVIVEQFLVLTKGVKKDELERAKTQLTSQLLMNLEVRPVMFEDLARQVLGHGYRRTPKEYAEKISQCMGEDMP